MQELYFSTDVETNGPIPGPFSMLSFASVVFNKQGTELGSFDTNLNILDNSKTDPSTMEFWDKNKAAYEATRIDTQDPKTAMTKYSSWIESFNCKPVFVAYPVAFDFMFVYWYLISFVGKSPFSHSGLDIKTLAMTLLKSDYRRSTKRNFPKHWFPNIKHTHIAIDDAREQGLIFCNILKDLDKC